MWILQPNTGDTMKNMFKLLIKLGVVAGLVWIVVITNPSHERHLSAIEARARRLAERQHVADTGARLHNVPPPPAFNPDVYSYQNYHVFSTMKRGEENASFGMMGKVFVYHVSL